MRFFIVIILFHVNIYSVYTFSPTIQLNGNPKTVRSYIDRGSYSVLYGEGLDFYSDSRVSIIYHYELGHISDKILYSYEDDENGSLTRRIRYSMLPRQRLLEDWSWYQYNDEMETLNILNESMLLRASKGYTSLGEDFSSWESTHQPHRREIFYNDIGLVSRIDTYNSNNLLIHYYYFEYDEEGNYSYSVEATFPASRYLISYYNNVNNNVIIDSYNLSELRDPNSNDRVFYRYEIYRSDAEPQLVTIQQPFPDEKATLRLHTQYYYDQNGFLIKVVEGNGERVWIIENDELGNWVDIEFTELRFFENYTEHLFRIIEYY